MAAHPTLANATPMSSWIEIRPNKPNLPESEIKLLRAAYAAFNARDIDAALATMTSEVASPKAFKGGFVRGPEEIRAYWTEQWSEINPHVEPVAFYPGGAGRILVDVHQIVCDLAGAILADVHVGHLFTFAHGLIQAMEVVPIPSSAPNSRKPPSSFACPSFPCPNPCFASFVFFAVEKETKNLRGKIPSPSPSPSSTRDLRLNFFWQFGNQP